MGLETVALLSLAVTGASAIAQQRQARKQASAEREGRAIEGAMGEINNMSARRKAARERRIKMARLNASANASGVQGSSGQVGAQSALGASFGGAMAGQQTGLQAAQGISAANQRAADARSRSNSIKLWTGVAQKSIGIADDAGWI